MLNLIAADFNDGWAFVRHEAEIFLLKPPYRSPNKSQVPEVAVEKAVAQYSFVSVDATFADWNELISYLKERVLQTRRAQGMRNPSTEDIRSVLRYAPDYILVEYLNKVDNELIPCREWEAAINVLTNLISLDIVRADGALSNRATELLKRCVLLRQREELGKQELLEETQQLGELFPETSGRYGIRELSTIINQVRERKVVWA